MAGGGLLSLKWNNHKNTFFHVLSNIRSKEAYCDVTIACDGRFYPVHKLVMSTCSDYFEEMFERTHCKHPIIVLKDIRHEDLEALLNYMYVGEVNVLQNELAGLIKAAECLMIKGLVLSNEAPTKDSPNESKQGTTKDNSSQAKWRRCDDNDSGRYDSGSSNSGRSPLQDQSHRESSSSSCQEQQSAQHSSVASGQSSLFRKPASSPHHTSNSLPDDPGPSQNSSQDDNLQTNPEKSRSQDMPSSQSQKSAFEVVLDDLSGVKEEPVEIKEVKKVKENTKNVLESSFSFEHMSEGESMSNVWVGGISGAQGFDGQMMSGALQSMGSGAKEEPEEIKKLEDVQEDTKNVMESSFSYESTSEGDSISNVEDGGIQGEQGFNTQMMSGAPYFMKELVAEAMPGSSGMQWLSSTGMQWTLDSPAAVVTLTSPEEDRSSSPEHQRMDCVTERGLFRGRKWRQWQPGRRGRPPKDVSWRPGGRGRPPKTIWY